MLSPTRRLIARTLPIFVLLLLLWAGAAAAAARNDARAGTWLLPKEIPPLASAGSLARGDAACEWDFEANTRTHPDESGQHIWPDIAYGPNGLVAVAWMDEHTAGGYHIFYSASTDGGASWSAPEKVDTRAPGAYSKFVDLEFTPAGIPVAVWEDDRLGSINVFLSKRDPANGGIPWTPNVRVNTAGSPPSGADFMNASLAILDEDRYFVAWTDWREGVYHQVYCRATANGGATWGAETRVSDGLGYLPVAGDPCLVVDPTSIPGQETLHCVTNDWRGNVPGGRYPNVYFYRSTNGGATWSVGVQVNDVDPYYQQVSSHALVRLADGTLTAGWLNDPDFTVHRFHTNVSTDQGQTWSASARVDFDNTGTYSSIAAAGGWVFAGFDVYEGNWNAYFRASSDGGRTWVEDACRMDDDASGSASGNTVVAAASPALVHAAWSDTRPGTGAWKIYASRGTRPAASVEPPAGSPRASRLALVCVPNPSARGTWVRVGLGAAVAPGGRLRIVDAAGRAVRSLALDAGAAAVLWDGADGAGRPAPPGIYWVVLDGDAVLPARVVRLR